MNENVVVKTKNSKGIIVLVILLLLAVICLSGYIVYDKVITKDSDKKEVTKTEEKEEIKDITNTELAKELHSTLITKDKTSGLYYENKISSQDASNKDLIIFNIKDYLTDNNIDYTKSGQIKCLGVGVESLNECGSHKINKSDIMTYMQKKYNTNINYNLEKDLSKRYIVHGIYEMFSNDTTYEIIGIAAGGAEDYVKSKLVKAEQDDEYIYLYDKMTFCDAGAGSSGCYNLIPEGVKVSDNAHLDTTKYEVYSCTDQGCAVEYSDLEKMSDYTLNNLSDKLHTFKHTFKKASDGNYYWVSSEISK